MDLQAYFARPLSKRLRARGIESEWMELAVLPVSGRLAVADHLLLMGWDVTVGAEPGLYSVQVKALDYGAERLVARLRVYRQGSQPILGESLGWVYSDDEVVVFDPDELAAYTAGHGEKFYRTRATEIDRFGTVVSSEGQITAAVSPAGRGHSGEAFRLVDKELRTLGIEVEFLESRFKHPLAAYGRLYPDPGPQDTRLRVRIDLKRAVKQLDYGAEGTLLYGDFLDSRRGALRPTISALYPLILRVDADYTLREFELLGRGEHWELDRDLEPPSPVEPGQVIIDVCSQDIETLCVLNPERRLVLIRTIPEPMEPVAHIQVADHLIISVSADNLLAGLWFLDLPHEQAVDNLFAPRPPREAPVRLRGAGGHARYGRSGWIVSLLLARAFGWQPAGTQAPPDWPLDGKPWDGSYFAAREQMITEDDAIAFAGAIRLAHKSTWETELPVTELSAAAQDIPGLVEEEPALLEELLARGSGWLRHRTPADDNYLGSLVRFCEAGAFRIERDQREWLHMKHGARWL